MRIERINEEYSKQIVETKDQGLVNIFVRDKFNEICEMMYGEYLTSYTNVMDYTEDEIVVLFYNIHSNSNVYRSLVSLLVKANKKVYLDDICISLFTRESVNFSSAKDRHIVRPNGSPLVKKTLTSDLFTEIGQKLLKETLQYNGSTNPNVNEVNLIEVLQQRIQGESTPNNNSTQNTSVNSTGSVQNEPQFIVNSEPPSLTEQAKDLGKKVKNTINSVATVSDKFLNKSSMYIINEKQLISEGVDISLFHIYLNKKFITTVLPIEFPIVILSLIKKGPIEIKEVEFVVTKKDEWTPPEKI